MKPMIVASTPIATAQCIVVTKKAGAFEKHFSALLNRTVFVFSEGAKAMAFWNSQAPGAATTFFIDYAALEDGETGFRITKAIRDAEKASEAATPSGIYLMADKPTEMDQLVAKRSGAHSVVAKNPIVVQGLLSGTVAPAAEPAIASVVTNERRRRPIRPAFTPELRANVKRLNDVLRKFIGAAATKVCSDAYDSMADHTLAHNAEAYMQYLASRIPSDDMRAGFLSAAKKK